MVDKSYTKTTCKLAVANKTTPDEQQVHQSNSLQLNPYQALDRCSWKIVSNGKLACCSEECYQINLPQLADTNQVIDLDKESCSSR